MDAVFAGLGAALVTALVGYFVSRRNNSGSISTSDAAMLWAESNALRSDYKDRAEKLEQQLEQVNEQLETVMTQLTTWQSKGDKMAIKIEELKKVINKLRAQNQQLLNEKRRGYNAKPRTA